MGTPVLPLVKVNGSFYKTGFLCAISVIGALLVGQFTPNRNIVTADQLQLQIAPLQASINELKTETYELKSEVSEQNGELRERRRIEQSQIK